MNFDLPALKALCMQEETATDAEWELSACTAILQFMPPQQAVEQTSLLVSCTEVAAF